MKKILLPTDFSRNARSAAAYVIKMFKGEKVEFILLNTFTIPFNAENVLVFIDDLLQKESAKNLSRERDFLLKKYQLRPEQLEQRSVNGILPLVVSKTVKTEQIDLVVMGTKGASGLKKIFLGSNTVEVLRKVDCPVLIVPENSSYKSLRPAVAIDLESLKPEQVFAPFLALLQKQKPELTLVNILTEGELITVEKKSEESKIISIFKEYPFKFHYMEEENIINGLNHFILDKKINMMVMIAHQYPLIKMLFHNSITEDMSMISRIPLLVLREKVI